MSVPDIASHVRKSAISVPHLAWHRQYRASPRTVRDEIKDNQPQFWYRQYGDCASFSLISQRRLYQCLCRTADRLAWYRVCGTDRLA
eukprot:3941773-Rhodomonas_salina.4